MTARALPALTHRDGCPSARIESFEAVRPGKPRYQLDRAGIVAATWRDAPIHLTVVRCLNCGGQEVHEESQ